MTRPQIIVFGLLELAALAVVVRLWIKKKHRNAWVRLLWSLVLLVPVVGLMFYGFLAGNDSDNDPSSWSETYNGGDD